MKETTVLLNISGKELGRKTGVSEHYITRRMTQTNRVSGAYARVVLDGIEKLLDEWIGDELPVDGWVINPIAHGAHEAEKLNSELVSLIIFLRSGNSLHSDDMIDKHFRQSLIATLETLIVVLKAPLVERNIIKRAATGLQELANKLPEQASSGFVGGLAGAAASSLLNFLQFLPK